jgi:hypothetical protein
MNFFQYSETNVMHFLFRIEDLYMFRALLAHPQEDPEDEHVMLETCRGLQF